MERKDLRDSYPSLSRSEQQVIARVVSEQLNQQTKCRLCLAETKGKAHRGKVMQKITIGVHARPHGKTRSDLLPSAASMRRANCFSWEPALFFA